LYEDKRKGLLLRQLLVVVEWGQALDVGTKNLDKVAEQPVWTVKHTERNDV